MSIYSNSIPKDIIINAFYNNEDIQHYRKEHSREIGERLAAFVGVGWLEKVGHGRGTRYRWPKNNHPGLFDIIEPSPGSSEQIESGFEHLSARSEHLGHGSEHLNAEQEARLMELAAEV